MLLEFVGHSYWNDPGKDQDSITTLRFKGGGTTLRTFQGNGEAYYIGYQSKPSEFIIQQSQVSISPTDTRKRFHVFAGFGNYSNGSSVIVKCNSFVYTGDTVDPIWPNGIDPSIRDMQTLARLIYELADNQIYRTKDERIMRKMKERNHE